MRSIWLLVPLALMIGCSSLRYSNYATRTGIPRAEIEQVAEAAAQRYKMVIIDVRKTGAGELEVVLGERRDSTNGLSAVFKKSATGWTEVVLPEGQYRVWDRLGK